MLAVSYHLGQKHYYVPYAAKKLAAYVVISLVLYFVYYAIALFVDNALVKIVAALLLLLLFVLFIGKVERKEFSRLPYVGRLYMSRRSSTENV